MALADMIRFFHEQPDHPLARRVAEQTTVHMVPMLNPDGAERFTPAATPRGSTSTGTRAGW